MMVKLNMWWKLSLLLSVFGFLKEFRPSEHFIYDFLIGPWRNVTEEEINQKVYPVATYSYLAQLVIVFLITDLCRYKPLIIVLGVSGIAIWSMLLWTESLLCLQIIEVLYGTFMATEVAYYTYIYAKVPKEKFVQVTSHTRSGILIGKFLSGVIGQMLISFKLMDFRQLNYITLSALILATIWATFLPSVDQSIYFNQNIETVPPNTSKTKTAFNLLWHHFINSYSKMHVIKWSIWWAFATCGFIQVQTYMQPLWTTINPHMGSGTYNGAVEAILTLIATAGSLLAGSFNINWKLIGELTLAVCTIVQGSALLIASQTSQVFVAYGCYIAFGAIYHFMITILYSEVAKYILEDSYGLVFGLNTLIALLLQSILMLVVADDAGFALDPRDQFLVYGGYFMLLAAIFIIFGIVSWWRTRNQSIPRRNSCNGF